MANAYILIDGDRFEFMGEVTVDFLGYENSVEFSRGGVSYPTSTTRPKRVSVESLKFDLGDLAGLMEFMQSCRARSDKFVATVVFDDECDAAQGGRWDFFGCLLEGTPTAALYARTITGFSFTYEQARRTAEGSAAATVAA